ncbi:MAG: DUF58 domain-containing protein [Candidatus Sumerlaeaceae bacterium]
MKKLGYEREVPQELRGTLEERLRRVHTPDSVTDASAPEDPFSQGTQAEPQTPVDTATGGPPDDGFSTISTKPAVWKQALTFSRTAVLWVGLPALILSLAFAFNLGLIAASAYAIILVVLASRVMLFFWLRPLRIERQLSAEVLEIGETLHVTVRLENPAPWPILWLYVEEVLLHGFARHGTTRRLLFLAPGQTFHLTYALMLTRRGCHQLGPLVLESGDVFGLFRRCRIDTRLDYVTVLPNYDIIDDVHIGSPRKLGELAAVRSLFEDVTRLRGIREYRRGDPLNRIHWKTTARRNVLHTKIFDPVIEAAGVVVLDFHKDAWTQAKGNRDGFPVEDEAVEFACTVARYLTDGGWSAGLLSNGSDPLGLAGMTLAQARATESLGEAMTMARRRQIDRRLEPLYIEPRRGVEQFMILRENLGRIALSTGLTLKQVLMDQMPHISRGHVLVVITGALPRESITAILRARELGYRVMLFVLGNPEDHDASLALCLAAGIEMFSLDGNWRMRELATGRRSL